METDEFFGSPAERLAGRRAWDLWTLVHDDARFACHGRTVEQAEGRDGDISLQLALTRLQGRASSEGVPEAQAAARRVALEAAGLEVAVLPTWRSGADAMLRATEVLRSRDWPAALEAVEVTAETPPDVLAALDALSQSCGLILPMGRFLRGAARPTVCLYARDTAGTPVACAASVAQYHPDHRKGHRAWLGGFAIAEAWRGAGVGLGLAARTMLAMRAREGFEAFATGIRPADGRLTQICETLGFAKTRTVDVLAVNPAAGPVAARNENCG